jgi:hypothetical protein
MSEFDKLIVLVAKSSREDDSAYEEANHGLDLAEALHPYLNSGCGLPEAINSKEASREG